MEKRDWLVRGELEPMDYGYKPAKAGHRLLRFGSPIDRQLLPACQIKEPLRAFQWLQ